MFALFSQSKNACMRSRYSTRIIGSMHYVGMNTGSSAIEMSFRYPCYSLVSVA